MKWIIEISLLAGLLGAGVLCGFSQEFPSTSSAELRRQREAAARAEAELQRRMQNMQALDQKMKSLNKRDSERPVLTPVLDKKAQERIRTMRRVDPQDLVKYQAFLESDTTGVFRLFPDFGCITKNVVRIDGECSNFVPLSSSFSFRVRGYTDDEYYHDIGLNGDKIESKAFFSQAILVSLGDVPIEDATLAHAGLKFLVDFKPELDGMSARRRAQELTLGMDSGGYKYADKVNAAADSTYALRMVAYRLGNSLPPPNEGTSLTELRFLSLALDKRVDEIIVFRIIKKDADGSLTIVWKELDRKEAPKIKFGKGERLADFRQP